MTRLFAFLTLALAPAALSAQQFPTADAVIKRMWDEGMTDKSQVAKLAQVLMDSIGPRLTSSPGHQSAVQWLQNMYKSWGIPVRAELPQQLVNHLGVVVESIGELGTFGHSAVAKPRIVGCDDDISASLRPSLTLLVPRPPAQLF